MLSLCTFFVLLSIGYFLIDSKTQTELVNKCKQNKFFILAGLVFIYFFFYRNNIEGITADQYNNNQKMRNDLSEFSSQFCWAKDDTPYFGEPISGSSPPSEGWPIKGDGTNCHYKMMRQARQGVLLEALTYDASKMEASRKFKPKVLPS